MRENGRLIAYVLNESGPRLSEYVFHALDIYRQHAEQLVVVVQDNLRLEPLSLQRLEAHANSVWHTRRPRSISNVWTTLRKRVGREQLTSYSEVLLVNDNSFVLFDEQMPMPNDPGALDAWTLARPDLAQGRERSQLNWLAVPGRTLEFERFWSVVKSSTTTLDEFREGLLEIGLEVGTVFERPSGNDVYLVRDSLHDLIEQGLPIVPWHALTIDPLAADRWAILPRDTYDLVIAKGYPEELIWQHLLRVLRPRTWYTNLAMHEVIPSCGESANDSELVTAIVMHVYYVDMLDELLGYAANVPGRRRLVITTNTDEKRAELDDMVRADGRFDNYDVRVVTSNRGRDISAFVLDCEDVLRDESIDLVVKLHSKRSVQDPATVSSWFRRHLFDNLLANPAYARNVYALFERESQLGMVFPPTIHMGLPTLGHAWSLNLGPAIELAPRLGITVPFDSTTPLSPYGSMFIARREVLAPLLDAAFTVDEFPDGDEYRDGSLAHTLERLISYIGMSRGFYVKTVQSTELAAKSGVFLECKQTELAQYLPPYAVDQVAALYGNGETWPAVSMLKRIVRLRIAQRSLLLSKMLDRFAHFRRSIRRRVKRS